MKQYDKNNKKSQFNINYKTSRVALLGILAAQAIAISFLENMIPAIPGLPPGAKPGFSNIVTMFVASTMDLPSALLITVVKALFAGVTRGVTAFLMSLTGGMLSTFVMFILFRLKRKPFGILGIAICSAVAHNAGQLLVAAFISGTPMILNYAPLLLIFAVVTGFITGSILQVLMPALEKQSKFFTKQK